MRLVIADPPYLGRAARWYGPTGRGHGGGRGRPDQHPQAEAWDRPQAHQDLVAHLEATADGWAVAMSPASLAVYLAVAPPAARVAAWVRANAVPSGSRLRSVWEPVMVRVPDGRTPHHSGPRVDDVLTAGIARGGWAGRKPAAWTH